MTADDEKRIAGEAAVEYVEEGMVIGLGTGSTVRHFIVALGALAAKGFDVTGVPTSVLTERWARDAGIRLATLEEFTELDMAVDGADEVDPKLNLIKGMGGALFREKVVAKASKKFIVIVDSSKIVRALGRKTPVPVEVHPFGWKVTKEWLGELGCTPALRMDMNIPFYTDNGNYILDCSFKGIKRPTELERRINNVPGVLENGLFTGLADLTLVGKRAKVEKVAPSR